MKFNLGDYVKVTVGNRVFKVCGFKNGWLIDDEGFTVNPKFCEPYKGATSVLKNENQGVNNEKKSNDI